ncbi:MAG: cation:proton antiporter [Chloroflexota bacterium]|nr:cation:proton antiporter [Chloroflexota bacterium]
MEGEDLVHIITRVVLQVGIILIAAKIAGEISERYLRVPPVLGELGAGVIIGPFALGGIAFFGLDPIFADATHVISPDTPGISTELWSVAQIASVVLLFAVGLETDLRQFLRFALPASVVALGGVVLPFGLGAGATVWFGYAEVWTDPTALFMGSVMTATSVGITARVMRDLGRMREPEGVTIIAAAVVDDVLGILILAIVVAMAETGAVEIGELGVVVAKALGFWLALTGLVIVLSGYISRALGWFRDSGAPLALALGLALLGAGLAESFGLAMIIGAYSVGLGLAGTPLASRIHERLMGVYQFLVPVFFVVMGMLFDLTQISGVLGFGLALSALAIVSKVLGAGGPALVVGFNGRGAWRIGLGMLPRGEVALIIAGIGLSRGVIGHDLFGVALLMTMITTVVAPVLLVSAFRSGRTGRRQPLVEEGDDDTRQPLPGVELTQEISREMAEEAMRRRPSRPREPAQLD